MKIYRAVALLMLLFVPSALTWAEEPKLPAEELATLVAAAVANNPELKSSQSRWRMFANKVKQASALEDPMFMFKLQNMLAREPLVFNKDLQSAKVIGITQQLLLGQTGYPAGNGPV